MRSGELKATGGARLRRKHFLTKVLILRKMD
jgi:hypothetical protein